VRGSSPTGETPTGPATHKGHDMMAMRGPEIDRGMSEDFVAGFLGDSKPLAPRDPEPSGELQPSGGGTFESKHDAFDAHINRDGTVDLHDKPDVDVHLGCLFGGCPMSIDDAIMRRHGVDPYAATKLHWLDRTRDERARIGLVNRKDMLAHSAQYMKRNLDYMWAKTNDAAERKRSLFELWDEVAETGDEDLVQGGAAARAYLIGFIRAHLPAGSPDAFTTDELTQLNARKQSHATFAPYDG
jgi:hypothetical protein